MKKGSLFNTESMYEGLLFVSCSILPNKLPLDRIDGNANPQLMLPLKGVEPLAIKLILTASHIVLVNIRIEIHSSLKMMLLF